MFSSLVTSVETSELSGTSRGGKSPQFLVVHHIASTSLKSSVEFMKYRNGRDSCPTYVVGNGKIIGMIPEEYSPASTRGYNDISVSVEVLNASLGDPWPVEESSIESLVKLLADLSNRYGWGEIVVGKNLRIHREFAATECPGSFIVERLTEIADRANEILRKGGVSMGYSYEKIDGQRVEVNVATAFKKMAAAFKAATGCTLLVTSGTRTREEQAALYEGWLARKPGYNLAAAPGKSNHEESGPVGPRALDLRDSGSDAGVTQFGTTRGNWLASNAGRFGFTQAGAGFVPAEAWHYEYNGNIGGASSESSGSSTAQSEKEKVEARQRAINSWAPPKVTVDGIVGPATTAGYKRIQKLVGVTQDGVWGSDTQAAYTAFYKARDLKLKVDGQFGSETIRKLQSFLGVRVDGQFGVNSKKALQRALGVSADGIVGPGTVRALQKRVGASQDGYWGNDTTKALQKRLNTGKF